MGGPDAPPVGPGQARHRTRCGRRRNRHRLLHQLRWPIHHQPAPADKLTVTVTSDDPALISDAKIAVETCDFTDQYGGHHNRRLTVRPAPGRTGHADLTLTGRDTGGPRRQVMFGVDVK